MRGLVLIIRRDLKLAFRRFGDLVNPVIFFGIVASLFPLALSPDVTQLRLIGPGVLWVTALLSTLLGLPALFHDDLDDGTLEQMALSRVPLIMIVAGKLIAHWLTAGVPLVIVAPAIAYSFQLPLAAMPIILLALFMATPALSVLGAIGAALTVTLRRGGSLLGVLVMPLSSPILIFGARVTDLAARGEPTVGPLYLLAALGVLAITLGPIAITAALRVAME